MTASEQNIILITGANQGIGFETAKSLIQDSSQWHILIGSRNAARGEEAVRQLQALPERKSTAEALTVDVTSLESVEKAAAEVQKKFGRLDTLCNNAGVGEPAHNTNDRAARIAAIQSVLSTNVMGVVYMVETFLPLLRESKHPRLAFVGSSFGSLTWHTSSDAPFGSGGRLNGYGRYRASKAAVNGLYLNYWQELSPSGFTVNLLDPGLTASSFADSSDATRDYMLNNGAWTPAEAGACVASGLRGDADQYQGQMWGRHGVVPW